MILWDETKNFKLQQEHQVSFEEVSEIILRKDYLDILENLERENQQLFFVKLIDYIYSIPFIINENGDIILKTIYPSRKLQKKYNR